MKSNTRFIFLQQIRKKYDVKVHGIAECKAEIKMLKNEVDKHKGENKKLKEDKKRYPSGLNM